jgi:hypothetical protein
MAACRCDESTKVVVRSAPFHFKTAPETKPDPATASVKLPLPAVALAGDADARVVLTVLATASEIS